ncbi:hypothetical protein HAX54_037554 [Datura stramonium]|uniref:Uncharacterized protein n=1 Tax=Datura stramonium TaxID=4076 RepID=A0ABS8SHA0_DATST|nr:hypothetical protein [Datura stramonium]
MHWVEDSEQQWEKFASMVPTKTIDELKRHYQLLVDDVAAIEAGQVPIPTYKGEEASSSSTKEGNLGYSGSVDRRSNCGYSNGFQAQNHDRLDMAEKAILGLEWRDERAYHGLKKNTGQQVNPNPSNPAALGPSVKHRSQPNMHGMGMYGAPMGHPVAGPPSHLASAVGTPVMLPHGHHPPYVLPAAYPDVPPPPPPTHQ